MRFDIQFVYLAVIVTSVLIYAVYGGSVLPQQNTSTPESHIQQLTGKNSGRSLLGIANFMQCLKKYNLDPLSLPNVKTLTNEEGEAIFKTCSPLLQLVDVGKNGAHIVSDDKKEGHYLSKRTKDLKTKKQIEELLRILKTGILDLFSSIDIDEFQALLSSIDLNEVDATDVTDPWFLFSGPLLKGLQDCNQNNINLALACYEQTLKEGIAAITDLSK